MFLQYMYFYAHNANVVFPSDSHREKKAEMAKKSKIKANQIFHQKTKICVNRMKKEETRNVLIMFCGYWKGKFISFSKVISPPSRQKKLKHFFGFYF